MEDVTKRVKFVTEYDEFVKEQSKFSFCGLTKYDASSGDPLFAFKYKKKSNIL